MLTNFLNGEQVTTMAEEQVTATAVKQRADIHELVWQVSLITGMTMVMTYNFLIQTLYTLLNNTVGTNLSCDALLLYLLSIVCLGIYVCQFRIIID